MALVLCCVTGWLPAGFTRSAVLTPRFLLSWTANHTFPCDTRTSSGAPHPQGEPTTPKQQDILALFTPYASYCHRAEATASARPADVELREARVRGDRRRLRHLHAGALPSAQRNWPMRAPPPRTPCQRRARLTGPGPCHWLVSPPTTCRPISGVSSHETHLPVPLHWAAQTQQMYYRCKAHYRTTTSISREVCNLKGLITCRALAALHGGSAARPLTGGTRGADEAPQQAACWQHCWRGRRGAAQGMPGAWCGTGGWCGSAVDPELAPDASAQRVQHLQTV